MRVAFKVLGCKVNTYEVEAVKELFQVADYEIVDSQSEAEVYVINTCSVTNTGDKKSRQAIRKYIRLNPDAVIVVMGCYSQLKPDEIAKIDGVDIILGTQDREKVVELVQNYQKQRKPIIQVSNIMKQKKFENLEIYSIDNKTRAFLKIQEGCNNFCTFCIIPWARGLIRSQAPEKILKQVHKLVENGIKEIVLTGIHTGGYGEDLENYDLADLLQELEKIDGLERIRISSIEITQLNQKFLKIFKNSHKIVEHLHIPIQAGSNQILKTMRRNYNLVEFKEKIKEIREIFPNIAITTDLIVGFPGESEELFQETLQTIDEIKFTDIHVFPYSVRNGTPAAKMQEQISEEIKKQRVHKVIEKAEKLNYQYNKSFEKEIVEVLVEKKNKKNMYEGYTANYIKVNIQENELNVGNIYNVEITNTDDNLILGKVI